MVVESALEGKSVQSGVTVLIIDPNSIHKCSNYSFWKKLLNFNIYLVALLFILHQNQHESSSTKASFFHFLKPYYYVLLLITKCESVYSFENIFPYVFTYLVVDEVVRN